MTRQGCRLEIRVKSQEYSYHSCSHSFMKIGAFLFVGETSGVVTLHVHWTGRGGVLRLAGNEGAAAQHGRWEMGERSTDGHSIFII